MFPFFRFGGLRLTHALEVRGEGDWMSGFLKALHARLMARIAEWKETQGEHVPALPNNPEGSQGQESASKGLGEPDRDPLYPHLVAPLTDPPRSVEEGVPPLEDFELVFESTGSASVDLASVFAPLSAQVDLNSPIMHLNFIRPGTDFLVPDLPA